MLILLFVAITCITKNILKKIGELSIHSRRLLFQITENNMLYKIQHYQTSHGNNTQSARSLIEFRVTDSMFRKGHLHLRCTASISDVYRKSADIEISEDTPRIASITGESPPYGHRKYSSTSLYYSLV